MGKQMTSDHETEQRILDAAHAVFMRHGTSGARTQDIADEAGVNKALLHYYFRTKDRLAEAVFQRAARQLLPPVMATLASDDPIDAKVNRVVELELEVLSRNPFLPAYIISEAHHHPDRIRRLVEGATGGSADGFARHAYVKLQAQIDAAVAAGTMRPIPAEQLAVNLLSLCIFPFAARPMVCAALAWERDDFDRFIEERKTSLPEFFLAGLRP
jgi:TetR/AcrR family transcriptional regulator